MSPHSPDTSQVYLNTNYFLFADLGHSYRDLGILAMERHRRKSAAKEERIRINNESNLINAALDVDEADDASASLVISSFHPFPDESISKYALFYIYLKHEFMQHFFWNMMFSVFLFFPHVLIIYLQYS